MIKIKLTQSTFVRYFTIEQKDKIYYLDYINCDSESILLNNQDYWKIVDEEWEEVNDKKLKIKLITFCIKHFNDYKPKINI